MSTVYEDLMDRWTSASMKFTNGEKINSAATIKKQLKRLLSSAKSFMRDGRRMTSERQNPFLCSIDSLFDILKCHCEIVNCEEFACRHLWMVPSERRP